MYIKNYMHRILLLCLITCTGIAGSKVSAQIAGLRQGKLPNGLTYYLCKDESSKGDIHFYLFQNVGAIVEEENQDGLAHYLEHMAFNATEHFPNGVMRFLRQRGIHTFDARTGINETLYSIHNIPASDKELADSILLIIKDWCNGISILPKDVEKERSIIIEEWRQRHDINKRLSNAIAPVIYNNTKYAERNIIGNEQKLRKFKADDLRRFYRTWYRPNLQCIAIIGDIDPNAYETRVNELFGKIPVPKSPRKRENIMIPDNDTPLYYRFIDKENLSNSFGIYQRCFLTTDAKKRDTTTDGLLSMIFNKLLSQRLSMLRNKEQEEYIAASVEYSPLVRAYVQHAWDIVPYEGRTLEALEQILSLRELIRREGFDEKEFEDTKGNIYDDLKSILEEKELGTPANWMEVFKQNYLYGLPIRSFREHLTQSIETLVELEVEDLNRWIRSWMDDKNLAFITYSAAPEAMNISLDQFNTVLEKVKSAPLMTFSQPTKIDRLIDFNIAPGTIVSEQEIPELEAKEWKLSNGARMLYKYVPELNNKFYFAGSAMGGRSLVTAKDLPSYNAMRSLIMQSGVYKYNRNQLHQWIKNKDIELSLSITDYTDGIGGNASLADAEDFFRYFYLVINRQRFDESTFRKFVERKKYLYSSRSTTGMAAVQDSIRELLFPPTPDNPREDIAFFDKMKQEELPRLYSDCFGNAGHFTFCIVGALPENEAKQLVLQYVASLPGKPVDTPRTYKPIDLSSPEKEIVREYLCDIDGDIGEVELSFTNNKTLTERETQALSVLEGLLQNLLFDELREKEGGTYSIGVKAEYKHQPYPVEHLNIRFTTEREKTDRMKKKTYEILETVCKGNFTEEDFKRAYVPLAVEAMAVKSKESEAQANPMMWLAILNAYAENRDILNDDEKTPNDDPIESLTSADVSSIAQKLIDGAKRRDIVVKSIAPEEKSWKH